MWKIYTKQEEITADRYIEKLKRELIISLQPYDMLKIKHNNTTQSVAKLIKLQTII